MSIVKRILNKDGAKYLGMAVNQVKRMMSSLEATGGTMATRTVQYDKDGYVKFKIQVMGNMGYITQLPVDKHNLYQSRSFDWPWTNYDSLSQIHNMVRINKLDPDRGFQDPPDDYVYFHHYLPLPAWPTDWGYWLGSGFHMDGYEVGNALYQIADNSPADPGGWYNCLVLTRTVDSLSLGADYEIMKWRYNGEPEDTLPEGSHDHINWWYNSTTIGSVDPIGWYGSVADGIRAYHFIAAMFVMPNNGAGTADDTHLVGHYATANPTVSIRALPITRAYTAKDAKAGGCGLGDNGLHIYVVERDTDDVDHAYLLVFDKVFQKTRQVSISTILEVSGVRGKDDFGTLEVRCYGTDAYILGVTSGGAAKLIKVDKDDTVTTTDLTLPTDHVLADFCVSRNNLYFLTKKVYTTAGVRDTFYVDHITDYPFGAGLDRYTCKYDGKICYLPIGLPDGDLSTRVLHTETYYNGCEYTNFTFPSICVEPISEAKLFYGKSEGFFFSYPYFGFPGPGPTFPYESTNASYPFETKIETFSVALDSDKIPTLTLNATDQSGSSWDAEDMPGGLIGERHCGLVLGKGINQYRW